MSGQKMHADEIDIDGHLVGRLLAARFPQWADLALEPVPSAGTDNAIYRLGDGMAVRLPRYPAAAEQVDREQRWLPRLAPHLPLEIPAPLAMGSPADSYPWHWSVYRWLEGENASIERFADPYQAAIDLGQFVAALQHIDRAGGPASGRGLRLADRDGSARSAIRALRGLVDTHTAAAAWEASLEAPAWAAPPVWTHGDLLPTNLLVVQGRLNAVIDFGGVGMGDPACDLVAAWSVFSAGTRKVFRAALGVDNATWERGRGWALSQALIIVPYYRRTNPALVAVATRTIDEVLADHRATGAHGSAT
ncbi:MAG: aminoglycoside phosphotransferase family protein [Actinomycetota bacterium]|nr:aminoglycoside phosphotransferase family protein [Actinomycetota bacterium]